MINESVLSTEILKSDNGPGCLFQLIHQTYNRVVVSQVLLSFKGTGKQDNYKQ